MIEPNDTPLQQSLVYRIEKGNECAPGRESPSRRNMNASANANDEVMLIIQSLLIELNGWREMGRTPLLNDKSKSTFVKRQMEVK